MGYTVKLPPLKAATPHPLTLEEMFAAAAARHSLIRPEPRHPSEALWRLLDLWERLRATPGMQAERHELADRLMDTFAAYPGQAPGWQRAWEALHPEARSA